MSDGSAFNLGDPSSMRDQGMPRNCVYTAVIKPEAGLMGSTQSSFGVKSYNSFLRRDGPTNNAFYSFGGSKQMRSEAKQGKHVLNPVFTDYDGTERDRDVIIYRKDKLERVTDYTKNISESIFSPGVLRSNKLIEKQQAAAKLRSPVKASNRGKHSSLSCG